MTRRILAVLLTLVFTATIDCRANPAQAGKSRNRESAQKFAEYGDIPLTEENQHLDNLAVQLISGELTAYIIVYAGRRAHPFEARQHLQRLFSYLFDEHNIDEHQLMTIDGGFRESTAVEIFLIPRKTKGPEATPTVRPREVEFIVNSDPLEIAAINKTADEILASALNKAVPKYPPLAKAARVTGEVGVRVTIDEEGRVVEARTMFGHPLLVDASEKGAREWTFTPFNEAGRPVKVVGLLIFTFDLDIDQKN